MMKEIKIFTLATLLNLFLAIFISLLILLNLERVINILGANKSQEVYQYVKDYLSVIVSSVFSICQVMPLKYI